MTTNPSSKPQPLTVDQRVRLQQVTDFGDAALARAARIVLLADDGLAVRSIVEQVGLSASGVRYWLRRFAEHGMELFDAAEPPAVPALPAEPGEGGLTVAALCARYSVDMGHAGHVRALAEQLFDATAAVHGLPAGRKKLLGAAAALHNVAYEINPVHHHTLGRDIILRQPLADLTAQEQQIVACMTVFHRGPVQPDVEPVLMALGEAEQAEALALTAILRIADGLDYGQTQTCTIAEVCVDEDAVIVMVAGDYADFNSARAERRADLWQARFGLPVRVESTSILSDWQANIHDTLWARLDPALPLPEAGRTLLGHYLALVIAHTDRLLDGEVEALPLLERHAARLHGVFGVFGGYFDTAVLAGFKKDTRWVHRHASEALLTAEVLARIEAGITSARQDGDDAWKGLEKLLIAPREAAEKASGKLRKVLDSRRYRDFVSALLGFSRQEKQGVFPGLHNKLAIETQAGQFVWQELTRLRVESRTDDDPETEWWYLRRFLQIVQYVGSLLGPEVVDVLEVVQPLADKLHAMIVMQTALAALRELGTPPQDAKKKQRKKHEAALPALDVLIAAQQADLDAARRDLEQLWAAFDSIDFRRKLALAIAVP
ncbi:MAG: hypothetical protein JW910_21595 [Anaerolineae bacterium]|nr:hypothetical protein [Anaerolineae bacterium]